MSKGFGPRYEPMVREKYPDLNIGWILTGDGQMLNGSAPAVPAGSGVPYYDLDVTASITESFNDVREEVQYYINFPPLNGSAAAERLEDMNGKAVSDRFINALKSARESVELLQKITKHE